MRQTRAVFSGIMPTRETSLIQQIEEAFDVTIIQDEELLQNQETYRNAIAGTLPHNDDDTPSMMIPKLLCVKMAEQITLEAEITFKGSDVAEFVNEQMHNFIDDIEHGFRVAAYEQNAGSRILTFLAADIETKSIDIDIHLNNEYFPVAYDRRRKLIDVIVMYTPDVPDSDYYYKLFGRFIFNQRSEQMTVMYKGFYSTDENKLGKEVTSLDVIENWVGLQPEVTYNNQSKPWFLEVNMPEGEALFHDTLETIYQIDKHDSDIDWAFEASQIAVDAPVNMFRDVGSQVGNALNPQRHIPVFEMPKGKERLFRNTNIDSETMLPQIFNPDPRYEPMRARLNDLLRRAEQQCRISYGTISDVAIQAKTATEVQAAEQTTKGRARDIQTIWGSVFKSHAIAMKNICVWLFGMPDGDLETVIDWHDGVVQDEKEIIDNNNKKIGQLLLLQSSGNITADITNAVAFTVIPELAALTDEQIKLSQERLGTMPPVEGEE